MTRPCPVAFVLSGYPHVDDGGAGMLYRAMTNQDGGPQLNVSGGTATPCGVTVPANNYACSIAVCPDGPPTLIRSWKSDALPLSYYGGTATLYLLATAINPWGTWYHQQLTADFTVLRGGATVYQSPSFTRASPPFFGDLLKLTSLDGVYFTAQAGDAIVINVYAIISFRGCTVDDGIRPTLTHGGGGAFGDARGVLYIPNIQAPGAAATAVYPVLAGQAWPVVKREVWATNVQSGPGGVEVRKTVWTAPLLEWELTYDLLRSGTVLGTAYTELEQLLGFYGARRGQWDNFLFDDVTDDTATNQQIGTGDGVTASFTMTRALGASIAPIGRPNVISAVTVGGVATTAYTTSGNVITFATPPANGAAVVWSGTYYWLVRFADPELTLENFMRQLWATKTVKLRQIRV